MLNSLAIDRDSPIISRFARNEDTQAVAREPRLAPDHPVLRLLEDPAVKLVSFDVFDTVVTRLVGDPGVVFQMVGKDLQARGLPVSPESFRPLRLAAERQARANRPGREVTLPERYTELACSIWLEGQDEAFVEAELQVERELICPVPEMAQLVAEVRRRRRRVIYTSDMYLPQAFLEDRLRSFGLLAPSDRLFVSSSCGGWKADGRLFQTVLDAEQLRPDQLLHCGNSLAVDIEAARRIGIRTFHYTAANPLPSEEVLNRHALHDEGGTSVLAGVSRKIRLQAPELDGDERVVWDTGASLTGPLLLMYAQWVLQRALQRGVTRLLFLARDAYLPYLVMQRLLADRPELGVSTHYLYGSRATYLPLGFERFGAAEWDLLTTQRATRPWTIAELERVLLAHGGTLAPFLEPLGFTTSDRERPLAAAEFDQIKQHALSDPAFGRALRQNFARQAEHTRDYLLQIGVYGPGGTAIVDTGWTTSSHAPLFHFLEQEGYVPLHLFYLGMNGKQARVPLPAVDTFLFNRVTAIGTRDPRFGYPRAFETLLMAPHGRTEGFRRIGSQVEPILAPIDNRAFVDRLFPLYQTAITAYVDEALTCLPKAQSLHVWRQAADDLVRRFWTDPSPAEARVWSSLEWESDPLGTRKYRLARPYRLADAWAAFVQKKHPDLHPQFWREAAVQLTPRRTLRVLALAILVRRILGRLTRATPGLVARRARQVSRLALLRQSAAAAQSSATVRTSLDGNPA